MKRILVMRILRAIMLMIVLNVLCLPTANADFGWEQVVGDGAGSGNGFGDADNDYAASMAVFNSYFYVGTQNGIDGCGVWRSSDGDTWNQVNTNGFGDPDNDIVYSMAVFGSHLYVGTENINDGCEVWRSSDGDTWNQVGPDGFGDANNYSAWSMSVLGSYLYVGTYNDTAGCEVWRSNDGTTWNQVVGDWDGDIGNGFGDENNAIASYMAVFGSHLYVGTYNPTDDCEVWRSSDGDTWTQVNTNGFVGDADNSGAFSMAVFGSYLYVGTYNDTAGCEVWRSSDGTIWNPVNTDGFVGDANNDGAISMAVFGSYLYVGTRNLTGGCEVWRLPQDSDDDGIKDDEDKCPCHANGINKGTCVKNVGSVIMSYEEGDELITCDSNGDCGPTGGYCQKVQGDYNWNGIGDVCEGYADFNDSGDINLVDLLDLILCYGKTNFETFPLCEQYDINDDDRVSAWDFIILTLQYGRDGFDTCGAGIAPAQIAKTGQNTCYDSGGVEINCLDTGQDGEYQKGVIGPSPRFTDNLDGTVTDNLTGLMWTQDAQQISGQMNWQLALTACNNSGYAGHTDWRLPNIRELE